MFTENEDWQSIIMVTMKGAVEDYDKVIESSSKDAGAYYNRGMAKYKIGSSHANKKKKNCITKVLQ